MKQAVVDGVQFVYEEAGSGEPVVFIHGVLIADAFRPLLDNRVLTARYRLVSYYRRGYGGSSGSRQPLGFAAHAADCARLLEHLGLERVHVVGHSFGASIALQLALEAPHLVQTLSLLEPGLLVGESGALYRHGLLQSVERYRQEGVEVAVDEFLRARWPQYREQLDRILPGAFEQAVADAAGCFESDLPGGLASQLGEQELRRIRQPALVILGEGSLALHPRFAETHRLLLDWLPNGEGFRLPGATHLLQLENPIRRRRGARCLPRTASDRGLFRRPRRLNPPPRPRALPDPVMLKRVRWHSLPRRIRRLRELRARHRTFPADRVAFRWGRRCLALP